jgi:hypothetical protein
MDFASPDACSGGVYHPFQLRLHVGNPDGVSKLQRQAKLKFWNSLNK